ncbi:MAG: hypothetical protein F9K27_17070 [Anaerolineae bacterium]|nr:MAG: hypothetical protein F9K27_17070 [Anaerolineae bacterium]
MATVSFEEVVEIVDRLSDDQQNELIKHLMIRQAQQRPLTVEEKIKLLDAVKIHTPIHEEPSVRREDWYGDDGR